MPTINSVSIGGHLTRDVEVRYSQAGKAWASFTVALEHRVGKGEEAKKSVAFVDCKAFGAIAENLADCRKGALIVGEGRIDQESWDDKNTGQKRSKLVVICNVAVPGVWEKKAAAPAPRQEQPAPRQEQPELPAGEDDSVPF
jgi:single-strand DNA-binding protein